MRRNGGNPKCGAREQSVGARSASRPRRPRDAKKVTRNHGAPWKFRWTKGPVGHTEGLSIARHSMSAMRWRGEGRRRRALGGTTHDSVLAWSCADVRVPIRVRRAAHQMAACDVGHVGSQRLHSMMTRSVPRSAWTGVSRHVGGARSRVPSSMAMMS